MQAAAGTRGAMVYYSDYIDTDFDTAENLDPTVSGRLPERDSGMVISFASFNLRDQVRTSTSPSLPLQFSYEAADFRLYFTLDNVLNMTRLWHDVANAAWSDSSLFVAGSTGYSTTRNTTARNPPPQKTAVQVSLPVLNDSYDISEAQDIEVTSFDGYTDQFLLKTPASCANDEKICQNKKYHSSTCQSIQTPCGDGSYGPAVRLCAYRCDSSPSMDCKPLGYCTNTHNSKLTGRGGGPSFNVKHGFCVANRGVSINGCHI